jgi:RNA polymerase sigma-70 factor (ECF subfamily)
VDLERKVAGESATRGEIVALIPAMRAFARSLCRNDADADDLVQDALTRAIAGLHRYEPGTRLKSWLFTITRNAFYNRLEKEKRRPPAAIDCERTAADSPQEWSAHFADFHAAYRRLPPRQREVLLLIGMLGESYEDTAAICGCAVGTVKSRLNRARAALIQEMGEPPVASPHRPGRASWRE